MGPSIPHDGPAHCGHCNAGPAEDLPRLRSSPKNTHSDDPTATTMEPSRVSTGPRPEKKAV